MSEALTAGLEELGIEHDPRRTELLLRYAAEIRRGNRRSNLVGVREGRDLVNRHLLDVLAGLPLIAGLARGGPVADVGSGAGLPGIPLAAFLPEVTFTLIERSDRRAAFLETTVLILGLANVRVICADVQALSVSYPLVTFRAFRPLGESLRLVAPRVERDGHVVAYAGRREVIDEQLAHLPDGLRLAEVRPVSVPGLRAERHLVVVEKRA
jgi:16S rRNA (guanine527-N7)-methyltransferase